MRLRSPEFTLAMLLAAAVAVLGAGVMLAHREELLRFPRDREPVRQFADSLGTEIQRLERHYEGHLRRIVEQGKPADEIATRALCAEIVGIEQLSYVYPANARRPDVHISANLGRPATRPVPMFAPPTGNSFRSYFVLDDTVFLHGTESSGWVDESGSPLLYWRRTADGAAFMVIEPMEIRAAIDRWLVKWCRASFASVRMAGGADRLLGTEDLVLAESAMPPDATRPDFILPLRGRFGTWHLASWDAYEVRHRYHAPTLVVSATLSVLLALLGVMLRRQQRGALALASQRVSFVNRVSHELRAPMTNILLNLDIAADESETLPGPSDRLGLVREEASRLSRMIENVLTFSRGEADRLELHPRACTPDHVVAGVLAQFRAGFGRRQITAIHHGGAGAACQIDADALSQILANLLSNVEKYAPGVTCRIESKLHGGHLVISVSDAGPGIPRHAASRIFDRFERLDSRITEGVTGTGLGLFIARELAQRMGGTLQLKPSEGGATFELAVPAPPLEAIAIA